MKRTSLVVIMIFFLALLFTIVFFAGRYLFVTVGWDGLTTPVERQNSRNRVYCIIEDLQLGMSKNQVEQIVNKHHWPDSYICSKQSEIRLRTPMEWGAQNWNVYLTFENNLLTEIKIRTEDSIFHKPMDAPSDIVYLQDSGQ